jgi:hypothetical protein
MFIEKLNLKKITGHVSYAHYLYTYMILNIDLKNNMLNDYRSIHT